MSCEITFSRTKPAAVAIPEHGIEVGHAYWVSDQELPDEKGNLVRLIGQRFLQREDEDDGTRPPRVAGNAYLVYLNCLAAGGATGDCSYGACNTEFCCEMKFEIDCFGDFQGNGTECILPDCHEEGVCCDFQHASDCMEMELEPCVVNDGDFIPNVTCDDSPPPCDGACCLWITNNVGVGCIENIGPFECRQLPGSPGAEDIIYTLWRGSGSTCPPKDCDDKTEEECCPAEGACCRKAGEGVWECALESPEQCIDDGSDEPPVFRGIGTTCLTEGICGGACCQFQEPDGPGGGCFDVDDNTPDCVGPFRTFLGPGTSCAENAGDCGLCCLVDPATCAISCREDMLQEECLGAGGTPFGPGAHCEVCDFVARACCIPRFGNIPRPLPPEEIIPDDDDDDICGGIQYICVEVRDCITCANMGGYFHPDADCEMNPCLLLGGACCCPEGSCPGNLPCPDHAPGDECMCYHTLEESCPATCDWHGPGRGCARDDFIPAPPPGDPPTPGQPEMPEFCLFKCLRCGEGGG